MTTDRTAVPDQAELRERADRCDAWAMSMLAHQLYRRRSTREEAVQWWTKAADAGDAYSMRRLAGAKEVPQEERSRWAAMGAAARRTSEPVPADVAAAAAEAGLGECRAIFGPRYGVGDNRADLPTIWLFGRGLVSRDGKSGELTPFPWGRSRIRRGSVQHHRNGSYWYTGFEFWVTRDDGATLNVDGMSDHSDEVWVLAGLIADAINKVRLGHAVGALQEGRRLDFGPVGLDAERVYDSRSGLPWTDVEQVDVRNGQVVIRRADRLFAWSKNPAHEIPDVEVFLVLADALRKAARGQRASGA
jgi:uncharacterized protein DUF6585